MSDSSELTFVRCPSCRSLIPAVSTRCRMCGASLDLEEKGTKEPPKKDSNRVRQNTMSNDEERELKNIKDEINAEEEIIQEDPLSDYIDEVEMELGDEEPLEEDIGQQSKKEEDTLNEEEPPLDEIDNSNNSFDILDLDSEEDEDEDSDWLGGLDEIREGEEDAEVIQDLDSDEEEQDEVESVEADLDSGVEEELDDSEEEQNLSPVDESSFEQRIDEVNESKQTKVENDEGVNSSKKEEMKKAFIEKAKEINELNISANKKQEKIEETKKRNRYENKNEKKKEKEEIYSVKSEDKTGNTKININFDDTKKIERSPKKTAIGRLYGWLVSFNNKNGEGIELREGKFFITRTELKDGDLVLDNPCISTPHAMVTIDPNKGFRVSDLMSDRGIFVRHKGDVTYSREEEVFTLENGDWVRFGDMEFLVTLIPYVGEK